MGFHSYGNKSIQGPNAFHRIHFAFQHPFHSTLDLIFISHPYKIQTDPADMTDMVLSAQSASLNFAHKMSGKKKGQYVFKLWRIKTKSSKSKVRNIFL